MSVQYDPLTFYRPETDHPAWVRAALASAPETMGAVWPDRLNLLVGAYDENGEWLVCEPGQWLCSDGSALSVSVDEPA